MALRTAINASPRAITAGSTNPCDTIKDSAIKRANELVSASSTASSVATQISAQEEAIGLAVAGITLAYQSISNQLTVMKDQRLTFDKERQTGVATFLLPTDKEETQLSKEEKFIKSFMSLASKNPLLLKYLGIHHSVLEGKNNTEFYSVLPFYQMSQFIEQPISSSKAIDKQRSAVSLFFKAVLPNAISNIDMDFQTDSKVVSFFSSTLKGHNYLNNLRAPRLLMMSLANLLWNLEHLVDPETGFPFSLKKCLEFTREVELFLNQLLDFDSPPYLDTIATDQNELVSFVRKIEIHTKGLRAAYADEQLHELNVSEVTNSAHRALRIVDRNIYKLIYKKQNKLTSKYELDEKASDEVAYTLSYLNELLSRNPELISAFQPFLMILGDETKINRPACTVLDALIIFCHLPCSMRHDLLHSFIKSPIDSAKEFAQTLKDFDIRYIKPIKVVSKKELHAHALNKKHDEVAKLTARRLIPLITLVAEDYRVNVDTAESYRQAKENPGWILTGKQQLTAINENAQHGNQYYFWSLSPFFNLADATAKALDSLPHHQYRMTQMTKLMDSVAELIYNYRSFLQYKTFQDFLVKCLNKVKEEYKKLDTQIESVDKYLEQDEKINRNLSGILSPMLKDLDASLDTFVAATENFERIISAPDFTDQQKLLLMNQINGIHQQFSGLFENDTAISGLIDTADLNAINVEKANHGNDAKTINLESLEQKTRSVPSETDILPETPRLSAETDPKQIQALKTLIQECYNGLSHYSQTSKKGALLKELLEIIEKHDHFTSRHVEQALLDLTRIVASYRETWFFQAAYAKTRSAKILIAAIKDKALNELLPIAEILFNDSTILESQVDDTEIEVKLNQLRRHKKWPYAVEEMTAIAGM